ncbi:Hsp70 family protein, partial [Burkholderia pseudomallei]
TYACRGANETLLGDQSEQAVPLGEPSRGAKLIGGSIRTEHTRAELTQTILDGFVPAVDASARPVSRPRAGHMQLGLPYAQA